MSGLGLFKKEGNCPACAEKRTHTEDEWEFYHPFHQKARIDERASRETPKEAADAKS